MAIGFPVGWGGSHNAAHARRADTPTRPSGLASSTETWVSVEDDGLSFTRIEKTLKSPECTGPPGRTRSDDPRGRPKAASQQSWSSLVAVSRGAGKTTYIGQPEGSLTTLTEES